MSQTPDARITLAAGCVVYRRDQAGTPLILLIYDKYRRWTLPKGHLEQGETEQAAAVREVFEETGLTGELGPLIGWIGYTVLSKRGRPRPKQVAFFLMHAHGSETRPPQDEGISAVEWFAPEAALGQIGYAQIREVLARGLEMLQGVR